MDRARLIEEVAFVTADPETRVRNILADGNIHTVASIRASAGVCNNTLLRILSEIDGLEKGRVKINSHWHAAYRLKGTK